MSVETTGEQAVHVALLWNLVEGTDPRQRKDYEQEFSRQVGLMPLRVRQDLAQYYRRLADLVEVATSPRPSQ